MEHDFFQMVIQAAICQLVEISGTEYRTRTVSETFRNSETTLRIQEGGVVFLFLFGCRDWGGTALLNIVVTKR